MLAGKPSSSGGEFPPRMPGGSGDGTTLPTSSTTSYTYTPQGLQDMTPTRPRPSYNRSNFTPEDSRYLFEGGKPPLHYSTGGDHSRRRGFGGLSDPRNISAEFMRSNGAAMNHGRDTGNDLVVPQEAKPRPANAVDTPALPTSGNGPTVHFSTGANHSGRGGFDGFSDPLSTSLLSS